MFGRLLISGLVLLMAFGFAAIFFILGTYWPKETATVVFVLLFWTVIHLAMFDDT